MKILVTGGCGFLGSNLAAEAIRRNWDLVVFDNLYRQGSSENLAWLKAQGKFKYIHGDIRNPNDVENVLRDFKPEVIFHLAGQVAMTTSIANPRMDFEINAMGSFNLLDAVRRLSPESVVLYSSTNKVYGDLEQYTYRETALRYECVEKPKGFDESVTLNFHSPYGVSKGSADQYMLDFARIYGLKTVVFRHSSMYGGRQFATYDQGWVGWFIQKALEIKNGNQKEKLTISGNGKQVRDLLYADDVVSLYYNSVEKIDSIRGTAFNIGGGIENSSSLLELFSFLEHELDITMNYVNLPPRESDQRMFVADLSNAKKMIGWQPLISKKIGIKKMIGWLVSN